MRTLPLTKISRKQSPFSSIEASSEGTAFAVTASLVVRAGARDLRAPIQAHLLQTAHQEPVTQSSRIWENVYFGSGPKQWPCPELSVAAVQTVVSSGKGWLQSRPHNYCLWHDMHCGPSCCVTSPIPPHLPSLLLSLPREPRAPQYPFT